MLRLEVPVLWVATSNDASELRENLLDRPGRFDRIFTFPRPGRPERRALVRHFSPWPDSEDVLDEVASGSHGLTGAHLKEVCAAAAFSAVDDPERYPDALRRELRRVKEQHRGAVRRERPRSSAPVGFDAEASPKKRVVVADDG